MATWMYQPKPISWATPPPRKPPDVSPLQAMLNRWNAVPAQGGLYKAPYQTGWTAPSAVNTVSEIAGAPSKYVGVPVTGAAKYLTSMALPNLPASKKTVKRFNELRKQGQGVYGSYKTLGEENLAKIEKGGVAGGLTASAIRTFTDPSMFIGNEKTVKPAVAAAEVIARKAKQAAPVVGRAIQDVAETGRPTLSPQMGFAAGKKTSGTWRPVDIPINYKGREEQWIAEQTDPVRFRRVIEPLQGYRVEESIAPTAGKRPTKPIVPGGVTQPDKFYIAMQRDAQGNIPFKEVSGTRLTIPRHEGKDLFIHKGEYPSGLPNWTISEGHTGTRLVEGNTRKAAIADVTDRLNKAKRFDGMVDDQVKAGLVSPRYGGVSSAPKAVPQVTTPIPENITPPKPVVPVAKEPWQMTKDEYIQGLKVGAEPHPLQTGIYNNPTDRAAWERVIAEGKKSPNQNGTIEEALQGTHQEYVKQALSEGKPVPPEVLKDYPSLVAKATPENVATEPSVTPELSKPQNMVEATTVPSKDRIAPLTIEQAREQVRYRISSARESAKEARQWAEQYPANAQVYLDRAAAFEEQAARWERNLEQDAAEQVRQRVIGTARQYGTDVVEAPVRPQPAPAMPPPVPPKPPATTGASSVGPTPQEIAKQFTDAIHSQGGKDAWQWTKQLRETVRKERLKNYYDELDSSVAAGMPIEEALTKATQKLGGKLPYHVTTLEATTDAVKNALKQMVVDFFKNEPMSFELPSTLTALENALKGRAIPRDIGTKGGSAYTRLSRIFPPEVMSAIDSGKPLEDLIDTGLLNSSLKDPVFQFDEALTAYLRSLDNRFRGQGSLLPDPLMEGAQGAMPFIDQNPNLLITDTTDMRTPAQKVADNLSWRKLNEDEAYRSGQKQMGPGMQLPMTDISSQQGTLFEIPMGTQKALTAALIKKPSLWKRLLDLAGIPRAIQASTDLSWHFRQGLPMIGTKEWWTSWGPTVSAFRKEELARKANQLLVNHPLYQYAQKMGLYAAPYEDVITGATIRREETFATSFFDRAVATAGKTGMRRIGAEAANVATFGVRGSNRAFTTAGNVTRHNAFYNQVNKWMEMGLTRSDIDARATRYARFLNAATGRGEWKLLDKFGDFPAVMNFVFFAPRFLVSHFQLPVYTTQMLIKDPTLRAKMARQIAAGVGTGMAALGLAKLAGGSVELDPRSTDFGKGRIGNTRIDLWGGYQPLARYTANLITGQKKSASGQLQPQNQWNTLTRFGQSKLNTAPAIIIDALRGKNFIGEPMELSGTAAQREGWNRLAPMFLQALKDATEQEGIVKGALLAAPGLVGAGVQSYESSFNEWMAQYPELSRLNIPYGVVGKSMSVQPGVSIDFTDDERTVLQKLTGQFAEQNVKAYMLSPRYMAATDIERKATINALMDASREKARGTILRLIPQAEIQKRAAKPQALAPTAADRFLASLPPEIQDGIQRSIAMEQSNPAKARDMLFKNPQVVQARKQLAMAQIASRGTG